MTLSLALDAALSGLVAAQRQTALAARNVANANTPGYVQKEAELSALLVAGEGRGVLFAGVVRRVDEMLQRDSRREGGLALELQTKAGGLMALANMLGQPDDEYSLAAQVSKLSSAFQRLGENPESSTAQRTVVSAAQDVTRTLNALSDEVQRQRQSADAAIANSVSTVNQTLDQLAELNRQISQNYGSSSDITDLQDRRDKLLDTLSNELGVTYLTRDRGELVVLTEGGTTLLDGSKVNYLSFTPTPQFSANLSYVPGGPGISGVSVDGQDISPASGYFGGIQSGRLAALFELRDTVMPQAQQQLDELASALADTFQSQDSTVAAGQTGLFTDNGAAHDRNDPAQIVGLAGRIAVNDLVVPEAGGNLWRIRTGIHAASAGSPGDATQVHAFHAAFEINIAFNAAAGLSTSGRLGGYAAELISFQGNQQAAMSERASNQSSIAEAIHTQRMNTEGVNIDDELQKLLLFEQSYAAAAKVMEAVRDMMDQLLDL